jgi:hypothetical protein
MLNYIGGVDQSLTVNGISVVLPNPVTGTGIDTLDKEDALEDLQLKDAAGN